MSVSDLKCSSSILKMIQLTAFNDVLYLPLTCMDNDFVTPLACVAWRFKRSAF